MREKLKEFQNSPRSIIAAFSAAVLFFCTVFTRLILKTDDGHFLGILHRNGFTVTSWLHERYTTVSGRIVGEWLMINFLRLPLIFWKLFIAALIIYIMYFLCRLSDFLGEKTDIRQRYIFACSVPLAVFLPCLNPSVFWFAGSFTFLVPFAALLITVTPLTFEVFGGRVNPMAYVRRDCFCRRGISGAVLCRSARAAGDSADFFGISTQAQIPSIHPAPAERSFRRCSGFLARASRARSDGSGVGF